MHPTSVPLSLLSEDLANVRRTGRGSEPAFVASIKAKGIIEPLIVRPTDKGYAVVNGGKRLASLQWMRDNSESAQGEPVTAVYPVPIVVRDEDSEAARDTSLTTALVRTPLHPVDRYEAFAQLVAGGMGEADIAAHYALSEKQVRQALALGRLCEKVRQAWRAGELDAEEAQAFTLQPDLDEQAKLFAKLKKGGRLQGWSIRREIEGEDHEASRLLKAIGEDAYVAAGGRIVKDLFGDGDVISDPKLIRKLADEKVEAKVEQLKKQGWSWIELGRDIPNRWALTKIEKKSTKYTDEDKARSGCIVEFDYQGQLKVEYGMLKPAAARKEKTAKAAAERKEAGMPEGAISNALAHRLSIVLTVAAGDAIALQPNIALAAMIAAFAGDIYSNKPVKLRNEARIYERLAAGDEDTDAAGWEQMRFADAFAAALKLTIEQQLAEVAKIIGRTLDFQRQNGGSAMHDDANVAALVNAVDPALINPRLATTYDAKAYFEGVNGALRAKAAAEAINADEGAKLAKMKKADAVAWCVTNIPPRGWLPPELRTAHYAGPRAVVPKVEAATPAPVKAKRRRATAEAAA